MFANAHQSHTSFSRAQPNSTLLLNPQIIFPYKFKRKPGPGLEQAFQCYKKHCCNNKTIDQTHISLPFVLRLEIHIGKSVGFVIQQCFHAVLLTSFPPLDLNRFFPASFLMCQILQIASGQKSAPKIR